MRLPIISLLLFFIVSLFNLSSCTYTPEALDSLDKTLKAYERAIRWRNFEFARSLQVNPKEVSDFTRQRLKNIKVTSYKTISKTIAQDYSKTELIVDIRYYYDNSVVERVLTHRQTWIYDEQRNRWQLDGEFPIFKFH